MLCSIIFYAFFLPTLAFSANTGVTFKNVEFKGYSVSTLKFTKFFARAISLKEQLPEGIVYDHIEFTNQDIPILRENSISDIEDLDELTISNSNLQVIRPGALKNVPQLRRLNLKGNRLEEILEGVFNNLQLSMLDLSKNRIRIIGATALDNLPKLFHIDFSDNLIESWNKRWFSNVPLLTRIIMQNNSLENIPAEAFSNLHRDNKFGSEQSTINLIFSHNKINKLGEDAFKGLKKINNLWLDDNKLTDFSEKLLEQVEVQDLRIGHNQIRCLNGDLSKIIKAETNDIDGNPLNCTCAEQIKTWAMEQDRNVRLFYSDKNCTAARDGQKMAALEKIVMAILKKRQEERETSGQREEISNRPDVSQRRPDQDPSQPTSSEAAALEDGAGILINEALSDIF